MQKSVQKDLTEPALLEMSGERCRLRRSTQHHPRHWFDNAPQEKRSVWLYSVKT